MFPGRLNRFVLTAVAGAALYMPGAAQAGCSRVLNVPAAPTGQAVMFREGEASGLVPDMFKVIGPKIGCTFRWSLVPRIRLEAMFENGSADMLIAATHTERRDLHGVFVPIFESRPMLITVASERARIQNFAELLERRELRIALVRGYDYGNQYRDLVKALANQGRLYMEPDEVSVARLLHGGMADATIMPASSFLGSMRDDPRVDGLAARLRMEALDELPWIKSGIYLSRKSLARPDRDLLEQALLASVKTGAWWTGLKRYYPSIALHAHVRPLESGK